MTTAQIALYTIVKDDALSQLSELRANRNFDIVKARRSVMRLLQLASNPLLAIRAISDDLHLQDNGIISAIQDEPISAKMETTIRLVRENTQNRRKTVVWTIFTQNILDLENHLADLNPVTLYGEVPTGHDDDNSTREGRIRRFHEDPSCMVMIANPAAAGEGISLHQVCHEAIYLDRSYISTHYLQSIDRIHRLGLPSDTVTNICILQIAPPPGLGSIDYSVSRRLGTKIRALQQLLNDTDLHEIALDEESAFEPIDYNYEYNDLQDLIEELEGNMPFDEQLGE
jgi:SNF2 family DNA or RNA helicase